MPDCWVVDFVITVIYIIEHNFHDAIFFHRMHFPSLNGVFCSNYLIFEEYKICFLTFKPLPGWIGWWRFVCLVLRFVCNIPIHSFNKFWITIESNKRYDCFDSLVRSLCYNRAKYQVMQFLSCSETYQDVAFLNVSEIPFSSSIFLRMEWCTLEQCTCEFRKLTGMQSNPHL